MTSQSRQHAGFTLIEVMIAITILTVLTMLALPSYKQWTQNTQIRTASEALLNGIQLARLEAVKRNTTVAFTLGDNTDWVVSVVSGGEELHTRFGTEGSKNAVRNVEPPGATTVTFSALGRVVTNADLSASLTRLTVSVPAEILADEDQRKMQIDIESGGQVRMCDPQVDTDGDPRKCK